METLKKMKDGNGITLPITLLPKASSEEGLDPHRQSNRRRWQGLRLTANFNLNWPVRRVHQDMDPVTLTCCLATPGIFRLSNESLGLNCRGN